MQVALFSMRVTLPVSEKVKVDENTLEAENNKKVNN